MTPLHEALIWRGITPPKPNSRRTTCPLCSHTRVKSAQPCLVLYPSRNWVDWRCYHCGWEDGEPLSNSSNMGGCVPAQPGDCQHGLPSGGSIPRGPWGSDRPHGSEAAA